VDVARQLVGWTLLVDSVGGVIVETEAYDEDDPASHGFGGPRPRNASMFGPPGRAYVYLSHGLHWCLNFVCREAGRGAAVLVRALEPTEGLERMRERRGVSEPRLLAAGPGRLGQALAIDRSFDGLALDRPPFEFRPPTGTVDVVADVRIGITKAAERPWRFVALGSRFLSRPVKRSTGAPAGR
jgi:DNA-3-methyladenine glycosylase